MRMDRVRNASSEAKAVRLADRLDNLTDMKGFTETRRKEYIAESSMTLEACRGSNAPLEAALEAAIRSLEAG